MPAYICICRAGSAERTRRINRGDPSETKRSQVRNLQGHVAGDVAEGVAPLVAVRRGIRQFAAADAVQDDQENAGEGSQACWGEK